jgi:hypothetical protein
MNIDLIALFIAGLGALIWLIRLEGRVNQVERYVEVLNTAIKAVESSHNQLALKVVEDLGKIRESLARIEGRISDGREIT